jgi:DUF1009 family protein
MLPFVLTVIPQDAATVMAFAKRIGFKVVGSTESLSTLAFESEVLHRATPTGAEHGS